MMINLGRSMAIPPHPSAWQLRNYLAKSMNQNQERPFSVYTDYRSYGLTKDVPVVHACGPLKCQPAWREAVDLYFRDQRMVNTVAPTRPDLTTVLINTGVNPSLLERACTRLGMRDHDTIGSGVSPWRMSQKYILLRDYLRNICKEYVLYLDAYDVLLFDDPSVLLQRFLSYDCKLVFMGESTPYPGSFAELEEREREIAGREGCLPFYRYLNDGAFIGRRDYILGILEEMDIDDDRYYMRPSDWDTTPSEREDGKVFDAQLTARRWYADYYPDIKLDYWADLFIRFDTRMIAHVTDVVSAEQHRPDNETTWW